MAGKLGRRQPLYTRRAVSSAAMMSARLATLGAPPSASVDRVSSITDWGAMMNAGPGAIGDCTCADSAHTLMLRTNANGAMVRPTDEQVVALYEAVGGYIPGRPETDQGAVEAQVCQYLKETGFVGHKIDDYANLDPSNLDSMRWSVELFGSCRLGVNMPNSAMDQFDAGQPWDVTADDGGSAGGHDVPLVHYGDLFYVVTWGKLQPVTEAFLRKYVEEAHAELAYDWIAANGRSPGGFDLATLAGDLSEL